MPVPQQNPPPLYFVLHQGQEQGPFDLDFIEAMIMSGVFPTAINVRQPESAEWVPLAQITALAHHQASPPPLSSAAPSPVAPKRSKKKADSVKQFAWIAGIVGGAFLLWLASTVASSTRHKKPTAALDDSSPAPSRPASSSFTATPSSVTRNRVPQTSYSPPATETPPIDDSKLYRDSTGRTYRVPHSEYNRLTVMELALTPKRVLVDQSEAEFNSLKQQVENSRITLDRTNQYEIDAFNAKVHRLNAFNDSHHALVNDYNRGVDSYNTELARVGTLIR